MVMKVLSSSLCLYTTTALLVTLLGLASAQTPPRPEVWWSLDIQSGQEIRGIAYDGVRDVLFVGSTYGAMGASIHQIDASNGTEISVLSLPKSDDDAEESLPHMLHTFEATQFTDDGSVDFILFAVNDGRDANGTGIGRVVRYNADTNSFAWELKTRQMNLNVTSSSGGYATEAPALRADGSIAYICQRDGTLSAIDTQTGLLIWQVVDGDRFSMSGTAILGDMLYVTTERVDFVGVPGLHQYNAAAYMESYTSFSGDGMKVGPYAAEESDGVYVTDTLDGLHKFDISTNLADTPEWTVLIEQGTSSQQVFERPILSTVDANELFAPARHTVGRVATTDGSVAWRRGFGGVFTQPLRLSTDSEYLYVANQIPIQQGSGGDVRKLNATTGQVEWQFRVSGSFMQEIRGALTLNADDSILFFGTTGTRLYAVYTDLPPTESPTFIPTMMPTVTPTFLPTDAPTLPLPTDDPTAKPTGSPTASPTIEPTVSSSAVDRFASWFCKTTLVAVAVVAMVGLFPMI